MTNAVSVVVTCYNLELYIRASIESVLAQNFAGVIDLIVVDDCSSDSSAKIIRAYDGVRYVRTLANVGVLMATVLGIREASGDVVFFLDGDDLWHPDKLRLVSALFEVDPTLALVTHDLQYVDGNGEPIPRVSRPSEVMTKVRTNDDQLVRDGILLHSDHVWLGSAYAIRKSLIDCDGFCEWAERLPDPFNTYQDWPIAFWAASRPGIRMGYLPAKLFKYRVHSANHSGDSRSADKAIRNVLRTFNTMDAMYAIAISANSLDAVKRATRRKRDYYRCLVDLYAGKRLSAIGGFVASVPYLFSSTESPVKEVLRFVGVQCLGLRRFLALVKLRIARVGQVE